MDLVVVVLVSKVVNIHAQLDPLARRVLGHRVEYPIARRLLQQTGGRIERHGGTCRPAVHKVRTAAYSQMPRQVIAIPQAESIARYVGQGISDCEWKKLRGYFLPLQVGIAGKHFPAAGE